MSLPGVSTTILDRRIFLSQTDIPTGPRVAIIATRNLDVGETEAALTGAVASSTQDLDPYNVSNEKRVIQEFGEGSQLHKAYLEAVAGGAPRVTLIPLPSDTVFDHDAGTITSPAFDSIDGGDLFDAAFAAVESVRADIVVPWGRGIDYLEYENPATPSDDPEIGFHADNTSDTATSWLAKVALKCEEITQNSHPCFAVLGVKPYGAFAEGATPVGLNFESMTPGQVSAHLAFSNLVSKNASGLESAGQHVSVVAAEMRPLGYQSDWGYSNGAAMYAGHIAQLDAWSSPTFKTIFNVEKLRYNPTKTQQEAMITKGLVPVALDFNRVPRWIDAQTFSTDGSDYTRLTTLRIVFAAVQMVRQVAQQFIGEAATLQNRNSLETAITAGLQGMQQVGALYASNFVVTYLPAQNKAIVDLLLTPAFELRNIEISVSIQI